MSFPHCGLFSCSSKHVKLVKEVRKGFISKFVLQCTVCKVEHMVESDKNDGKLNANGAAVMGTINVGCGFSQLNELAACLNMPGMSYNLYQKIENNLNEIFEEECWQSMIEAGREEAKIAIESGNVDENNVPLITVIADGAWCKRSYRTNYNAKSGAACIVGEKTGKILFLGIRNKYCAMCSKNQEKSHLCFKNWDGSSSAMESDIILEGYKLSMEMHGVKYAFLVGDGDSSVYKKILESKPYGTFMVQKIECANHLLRNYVSKLRDLAQKRFSSKGNQIDLILRHSLKTNIERLRISIDCAIKYRRNEDGDHQQKVDKLRKDVINSVRHVFGQHDLCEEYFCKGPKPQEQNLIPLMEKCGLYNDVIACANRLAHHSSSLIRNMTNNSAENYNSVLAKFIGGKRVDYSKKGAYGMRCNLAGLSINYNDKFYTRLHTAIAHKSPGSHTKKFAERLAKRRDRNRCRKRLYVPNNNPRKLTKKRKNEDDNEDYGANIHALDIDPEEFLKQKTAFLSSLQKTEEEIIQLSTATVEQTTSNLWFSERMKRLTASSFGKICKMRATTDSKKTCKTLLQSPFTGNKYTNYGKDHESIARAEFAEVIEKEIGTCGFFVGQNKYFYLGATPDGLIGDEALVEIKCPYSAREDTPTEAIVKKK
jgi:hypothetical protein